MKFVVDQLEVGQTVEAEVVDAIHDGCFIVSVGGDLLRVQNQSGKILAPGQRVSLVVNGLSPLELSLGSAHLGYRA